MKTIPIKYTGPVSMNIRSINSALYTIKGVDVNGNSTRGAVMYLDELSNVLSFLESNIMSTDLYFDGTVPEQLKIATQTNIESLEWLNFLKISPIEVNQDSLKKMCKGAAEQSSELFRKISIENSISNSFDRKVKKFQQFEKDIITASTNKNLIDEIVERIIFDVKINNKSYTGSKSVVGILLAEVGSPTLLEVVSTLFLGCKNEEQKSYLVGSIINRFRTNYINKLSSQDQYEAAYLINPALETLQSQQVQLLWKYILKRIEISYNTNSIYNLQGLFSSNHKSFPIGMAAILHPKTKNVHSLFENSMNLHDKHFAKLIAKETDQNRYLHEFQPDAFQNFQEKLMGEVYYDLVNQKPSSVDIVLNHIPEVIGATGVTALMAFASDNYDLIQAATTAGGTLLATNLARKGMELVIPNNRYNVFVNNVEKLTSFYSQSLSSGGDLSFRLREKINMIFDRKLVL